ncbi:hypothetical protein TNCV_3582511 [Trichonephila clavipes]|nr:hypothetical protein TNCV_3582511 [Trichonephila clavipes]
MGHLSSHPDEGVRYDLKGGQLDSVSRPAPSQRQKGGDRSRRRLKWFSTLQLDHEIRKEIHLQHKGIDIIKEPFLSVCPSSQAKIGLNLLKSRNKKEPAALLKLKIMQTIEVFDTARAAEDACGAI